MASKTVHIIVKDGFVETAYANFDVDVVIYDLDSTEPAMIENVEQAIEDIKANCNEIEVM
jgi:hypothetical protein